MDLRYGMRSSQVLALQKQLESLGHFKGPTTGYFGPLTRAAVKHFEKAHGYSLVDGIAGETVQRVAASEAKKKRPSNPVTERPTAPGSPRQTGRITLPGGLGSLTYDKAAALVRQSGGKLNPGGKPTVLALRTGSAATSSYRDVYVVLSAGHKLSVFQGSTRPTSSGTDRAMLEPGQYTLSPRWRDGKYNNDAFLVKTGSGSMNVGVDRDRNGDGTWSRAERARHDRSDTIRLHRGGANTTSSTGCLNIRNYDAFLRAVGGRNAKLNMSLVEL